VSGEDPETPERAAGSGPELARAALEATRAAGWAPTTRRRSRNGGGAAGSEDAAGRDGTRADGAGDGDEGGTGGGSGPRRRRWSGAGADPRDPQPFGRLISRMVADRGWERATAEATVLGAWDRVVGSEIAAHCRPVGLREGVLTLQAESTAWATQLRLLAPRILGRISAELGPEVVRQLRVHGPAAPSWKKGPRSAPGRGPRDTYG